MEYIIDANKDPSFIINILHRVDDGLALEVTEWLDDNCPNWKYSGTITLPGEHNEGLSFDFENESDFIGFKLRWL